MSITEKASRRLLVLQQQILLPSQLSSSSSSDAAAVAVKEECLETMPVAWGGGFKESERYNRPRAVIVDGCRTPFARSFGQLRDYGPIELGVEAVRGLLEKTELNPNEVEEIIWGAVVMTAAAPNVAREIALDLNLPAQITGVTVSRACLSGMQAIFQAVEMVENDHATCVIAGGGDSLSNAELTTPTQLSKALVNLSKSKKKDFKTFVKFFQEAGSPAKWVPVPPSVSERFTGRTMGYHADLMAQINNIPRAEQDIFACESHAKASVAQKAGYLAEEICPIISSNGKCVDSDDLIRGDTSMDKISQLRTAFRKKEQGGTVSAATSSALTDGASGVLVMSEAKAKELGYPTDIVMRSIAMCGVDPFPQLLLAPALAIPKALECAGLTLDDIDIFEIHEAFAAQVLSTLACLESESFCKTHLGLDKPVGSIPREKINVNGSSIAIGHPFAATGGRLVTSAANELRRSGKKFALLSVCAAGGLGGVMILERV